jgi:hypothetical protein
MIVVREQPEQRLTVVLVLDFGLLVLVVVLMHVLQSDAPKWRPVIVDCCVEFEDDEEVLLDEVDEPEHCPMVVTNWSGVPGFLVTVWQGREELDEDDDELLEELEELEHFPIVVTNWSGVPGFLVTVWQGREELDEDDDELLEELDELEHCPIVVTNWSGVPGFLVTVWQGREELEDNDDELDELDELELDELEHCPMVVTNWSGVPGLCVIVWQGCEELDELLEVADPLTFAGFSPADTTVPLVVVGCEVLPDEVVVEPSLESPSPLAMYCPTPMLVVEVDVWEVEVVGTCEVVLELELELCVEDEEELLDDEVLDLVEEVVGKLLEELDGLLDKLVVTCACCWTLKLVVVEVVLEFVNGAVDEDVARGRNWCTALRFARFGLHTHCARSTPFGFT